MQFVIEHIAQSFIIIDMWPRIELHYFCTRNDKFSNMKRYIFYFLLTGLFATAISCADQSQSVQSAVRVKCDTVRITTLSDNLQFPARVKAAEEVNMAFKLSGSLMRVFVQEGQYVRQGELLAQIDPRDYELQLQAVEAEWLGIKAEAERVISLYADSVTTESDYDKARYGLQQITAKRENAQNQLADTKIYAPFDGYVKRCLFDPPTVIGAGVPVISLHSSSVPEIEISIPSSVYHRRGDIASFKARFDFLKEKVPLQFISISSNVNSNQLYTLRLALPSSMKEKPSVGMLAVVDIAFRATSDNAVEIPASAIFHDNEADYVWIITDDKVVKRVVEIAALHTNGTVVVVSGLELGEVVVSAGVNKLKEGQNVKPLPSASDTNIGGLL